MNFPANMTGFVPRLFLFRCLCTHCHKEYWLHPQRNVFSDTGLCSACEVAVLHQMFPEAQWKYQPVAQKALKQVNQWGAFLEVMGGLAAVALVLCAIATWCPSW
jgi:hypothetical protein